MTKNILIGIAVIAVVAALPFVARGPASEETTQEEAAPAATPPKPASATNQPAPRLAEPPGTPQIVSLQPANGATDVPPGNTQLVVVFDRPMEAGFSFTGGGDQYPDGVGDPYWQPGGATCVFPVSLKPGWSYRLGLNSKSFKNFRSAAGVPLTPVVWKFSTK